MPKNKHPENLDTVATPNLTQRRQDFIHSLLEQAKDAESSRGTWQENQTRWFKRRMGIRPASVTYPWPNANNYSINLIDEKIRKLAPMYVNMVFEGSGRPVVSIKPIGNTPQLLASHVEVYLDWLIRFGMNRVPGKNFFESLCIIVDRMLETGFTFAKVIQEHSIKSYTKVIDIQELSPDIQQFLNDPLTSNDEIKLFIAQQLGTNLDQTDVDAINSAVKQFRSGSRYIKFSLYEDIYSGPRVIPVPTQHLLVPSDTTDLESARFIVHRMYVTAGELKRAKVVGKYNNVDDVLDHPSDKTSLAHKYATIDSTKSNRDGVDEFNKDSELIEIWEIYTWYDTNGDGVDEKVVVTVHPATQTILRFIEFPYDHGKWPFIRFDYELTDERWYSPRGIAQILDHYQSILTKQENAKLNYMDMANSMQFKYRIGKFNMSNMRFIPGQGLGVHRMEDIEQLHVDRIDISFDTEMAKIRGLAEQYIGQPDLALGNLQNKQERRTAFEVSEAVAMSRQVFSMPSRLWNNSLQKMYNQILDLVIQYGPDEHWVQVTGSDPIRLTREQLSSDLIIVPSGDFTMLSQTLEQQRDFAFLQLEMSDQTGAINQLNAITRYLQKHYPAEALKDLRTPEEFQQYQQQLAAAREAETQTKLVMAGRVPAQSVNSNQQPSADQVGQSLEGAINSFGR